MKPPTRHGRLLFPVVTLPEATRLPRGASYSGERDAGCCLIALRLGGKKAWQKKIIIRNCYRGPQKRGTVVENMREYDRTRTGLYSGQQGVPLARLLARGFTVERGPFMVAEAAPNLMREIPPAEFEQAWQAMQLGSGLTHTERYGLRPEPTPAMRLISLHWKERKVRDWTPERVKRLCALWQLTPAELAEMIQWNHGAMEGFVDGAELNLPGPVCVWFYFLESVRLGVDVFPNLKAA